MATPRARPNAGAGHARRCPMTIRLTAGCPVQPGGSGRPHVNSIYRCVGYTRPRQRWVEAALAGALELTRRRIHCGGGRFDFPSRMCPRTCSSESAWIEWFVVSGTPRCVLLACFSKLHGPSPKILAKVLQRSRIFAAGGRKCQLLRSHTSLISSLRE